MKKANTAINSTNDRYNLPLAKGDEVEAVRDKSFRKGISGKVQNIYLDSKDRPNIDILTPKGKLFEKCNPLDFTTPERISQFGR